MLGNARAGRVVLSLFAGVTLVLLAGPAAGWAQWLEPVVDGAASPARLQEIGRQVPRSLWLADLYHAGNLQETPALDTRRLEEEDAAQTGFGPLRIAVVQDFETRSDAQGQWSALPDGGHLWTMAYLAPAARSIRLRARPWRPPPGAELLLYDARDPTRVAGPFTRADRKNSDEFWTPTLYSEEVRVEYYLPAGVDPAAPEARLTIDALLNQYRAVSRAESAGPGLAPEELGCHLDVTCYLDWANEAESIGALTYVSDPPAGGFFCTGSLLNRAPQDWTPFFQTARHCGIDTQAEAESVLVTWNYQTATCNGAPPDPGGLPQTSGAVLLVDDATSDYTLIGLESDVPGGIFYLGWDPNYWTNGSAAVGIHHPDGYHKRITFGTKTMDDPDSCAAGVTPAWYVYIADGAGELEPGSSGSPVFDSAHHSRGVASCATWSCSSDDTVTYGKFYDVWFKVEPFLFRDAAGEWDAYVNAAHGGTEWGTLAQPFRTALKGVFAVKSGSNVYVEAGSYNERFVVDKAMTLNSRNGTALIGQ